MNGTTPRYKFCPQCGQPLTIRDDSNILASCPNNDFVQYDNPKPCVAVLIVSGNEILLGKRAVEPRKGYLDILGGFIDSGETAEDAVRREIQEETGLTITKLYYLASLPDVYGDTGIPTLNFCYVAEVEGRAVAASDVESLHRIEFSELPHELAFAHQTKALKLYRDTTRERPS